MLPDRVSNPGPLTDESGVLPIALCDPAALEDIVVMGLRSAAVFHMHPNFRRYMVLRWPIKLFSYLFDSYSLI